MFQVSNQFCPRCKSEIPEDRQNESVLVCASCGHSHSPKARKAHDDLQNRTIKTFIVFSIAISLVYIHTVHWGKHSLRIIPLKAQQMLGVNSKASLSELAKVCQDRKKYTCVVRALSEWTQIEPNNLDVLSRYAKLLEQTNRIQQASKAYANYFSSGGNDPDLAYSYGKILSQTGHFDKAQEYFEFVLNSRPDVFQITVSKEYVLVLMRNNNLKEAKKFILNVRKRGKNDPRFMESELDEINRRLVVAAR